jgi:competence protein ComEA
MFRQLIAAALAAFALTAFAGVDINRASRAELETVKGVGPGLSAKIMKAREAGEFKDWGDLVTRVPGVGAASAGKLSKAGLTVAGKEFDASQVPAAKPARQRKGDSAQAASAAGSDSTRKPAARKDKADKPAV